MKAASVKKIPLTGVALLLYAISAAGAASGPEIPVSLQPASSEVLAIKSHATGVQIYECKADKDDPAKFKWSFKSPEAELADASGKKIAKHFAGPTWQSPDGSSVVGELKAKENSPDANAIPWLLLTAKSHSGKGIFSEIQSIQRVATSGGNPPSTGCTQAQSGQESRVPYQAEYLFYKNKL